MSIFVFFTDIYCIFLHGKILLCNSETGFEIRLIGAIQWGVFQKLRNHNILGNFKYFENSERSLSYYIMILFPSKSPEFFWFFEYFFIQFSKELIELLQKQNSHRWLSDFILCFLSQCKQWQTHKNSSKHKKKLATCGNLNGVVWSCFRQCPKKEISSCGEKDESINQSINGTLQRWADKNESW